jgi:hypothetical protein
MLPPHGCYVLISEYAGGAAECIEKIQCPAGFVFAHAVVADAYRERHNTDTAVWNGMIVSPRARVATTIGLSDIEIYQCMSCCFWYPIRGKTPAIIRIAAWQAAGARGRDYGG